MFRQLIIAALVYTSLVIQSGLGTDLQVLGLQPWLPGLGLVACALLIKGASSLCWAGLWGLGVDCLSGEKIGVNLVVATIVASSLLALRTDGRSPGLVGTVMYVLVGTFLWRGGAAIAHGFLNHRPVDFEQLLVRALIEGVSTGGIAVSVLIIGRLVINVISPSRYSSVPLANHWSMLTGE